MESQNVEYKKTWRDEYLKWICAFANTEGGKLYIGIDDNGNVCGVDDPHKLSEDIPNKIRNTMGLICTVNLLNKNGLDYFEIITEKYPFPVSYHGKYYRRTGSTMQEVSGVELDKMILSVQDRTWDSVPVPHISVDDLENDAIRLFKKKALDSDRLDEAALNVSNKTLIQNLHITEGNYLTRACMLAFYPDPEKWVTGAYIKVAYFENDADILYQDEIHGPLILQVEKTMDLIYSKYMKALISYDGIQRIESYMIPQDAMREIILNAIAHKNYPSGNPIQIKVFDDHITIMNEGFWPFDYIKVEDAYSNDHDSFPNNPNIAEGLYMAGDIETWGSGFEKIKLACSRYGTPLPEITATKGNIKIRITPAESYMKVLTRNNSDLTSEELRENFGETSEKLRRNFGITSE